MEILAETEFLFALRPRDRWNPAITTILEAAKQGKIDVNVIGSAVYELRTVLYSQGKKARQVYKALIHIRRKLADHEVDEKATDIDDCILADKLREEYPALSFFDALHGAAALRRNQTLLTNDKFYDEIGVKVQTFEELRQQLT